MNPLDLRQACRRCNPILFLCFCLIVLTFRNNMANVMQAEENESTRLIHLEIWKNRIILGSKISMWTLVCDVMFTKQCVKYIVGGMNESTRFASNMQKMQPDLIRMFLSCHVNVQIKIWQNFMCLSWKIYMRTLVCDIMHTKQYGNCKVGGKE